MDKQQEPTPFYKQDKVHIHKYDEFHFLYMKMSWSPEGGLWFGVFYK